MVGRFSKKAKKGAPAGVVQSLETILNCNNLQNSCDFIGREL
jgi:hypothetical protein